MRRALYVLAVLSVAIGVAAFAAVSSTNAWQRQQIRSLASTFAPDLLVVRIMNPLPNGFVAERQQEYGLTFEEAQGFADLPGIDGVAFTGSSSRTLGGTLSIARLPVSENVFDVLGFEFAAGEAFGEEARLFDLPVAVIGHALALDLFDNPEEAVNQVINLGGQRQVRVEGVLEPVSPEVLEYQAVNVSALLPYSASNAASSMVYDRPNRSTIYVSFPPGGERLATTSIQAALADLPTGFLYEVVTPEQWLSSQVIFRNRVADELQRGSTWIVVLALVATVGNLLNTLGLRAAGQARTIALRRALGATRLRLFIEVAFDGLKLGVAGTVAGLALWPVADRFINSTGRHVPFTLEALVLAAIVGLAVSVIAAVIPAIWVLSMPTYKALREEISPPAWEGIALTGMAAGVIALMVAAFIQTGTNSWFHTRLAEIGAQRVVMSTIAGPASERTSARVAPPLDDTDLVNLASLPGVKDVAASIQDPFMAVTATSHDPERLYEGVVEHQVDQAFFDVNPLPVQYGRTPTASDEILLGSALAARIFPGIPVSELPGEALQLASNRGALTDHYQYTIAGIFKSGTWESHGDIYDGIIRFRRQDDRPMSAANGADIHIEVDLNHDYAALLASMRQVVDARHDGFAPAVVREPAGNLTELRTIMNGVSNAWSVIAWVSFIVGAAGLASVVIFRVVRSRAELALKRALGATQKRISLLSALMGMRIAGFAIIAGMIIAVAAIYWTSNLAPWTIFIPWQEAVFALLVSFVVSLTAIIGPVIALSRTAPWLVLKEE